MTRSKTEPSTTDHELMLSRLALVSPDPCRLISATYQTQSSSSSSSIVVVHRHRPLSSSFVDALFAGVIASCRDVFFVRNRDDVVVVVIEDVEVVVVSWFRRRRRDVW